jgi:Uma2 family endonuclease
MPDDGNRYELADGQLELISPAASPKHQAISGRMLIELTQTCESDYVILHEVDVILSSREVRRPDLIMLSRSRLHLLTGRGIEGPPNLVVEVLSPHSLRRDKVRKLKIYAKYSIPEYWIVDPASWVLEQFLLTDEKYELHDLYTGDELIQSELLPCVSFTMQDTVSKIPPELNHGWISKP